MVMRVIKDCLARVVPFLCCFGIGHAVLSLSRLGLVLWQADAVNDADAWSRELAKLKTEVGDCDTTAPVEPTGALSGDFSWRCTHGRLKGSLALAPHNRPASRSGCWSVSFPEARRRAGEAASPFR